jgi:hypothetical protein
MSPNRNPLTTSLWSGNMFLSLTRVSSANVEDEGLRIGGRGHRMNSKVNIQANKAELDVY